MDFVKLFVERNRVVVEGVGVVIVVVVLFEKFFDRFSGNIVCVIFGGNIDINKLIYVYECSLFIIFISKNRL